MTAVATFQHRDRALRVVALDREEHLRFISGRRSASFTQCPAWAEVKPAWDAESVGWVDGSGTVVGAALVLYRKVPGTRRAFAYVPEGPIVGWALGDPGAFLVPLAEHAHARGAFTLRVGPPLARRTWEAATVREAMRTGRAARLRELCPDAVDPLGTFVADRLTALGWRPCGGEEGEGLTGGDTQPRHVMVLPLAGQTLDPVWQGLSQGWRRHIRTAQRSGVTVEVGGEADLPAFYDLLLATQNRNGFDLGRSLSYYQRQYRALTAEHPDRMRLYLARHGGEILAAHTMNVVGDHVWYQTGASADHNRRVQPSHALQWRMIEDAHALGAATYDMRGVQDVLDPDDRRSGLLRWKLGTGGQVVERLGEWELALDPVTGRAFSVYLATRRALRGRR